jgi:two-component system LytT family response regulator
MISCVIIDDKTSGRVVLKKMLQEISTVMVVGEAASVKSGIEIIKDKNPDLVFLDIKMPDGDGFEVLKAVKGLNFFLIFTTAHDSYALSAIKEQAVDYLIKPIGKEELKKAIEKVLIAVESKSFNNSIHKLGQSLNRISIIHSKVPISTVNGLDFIPANNIIRCSSESNYTRIFLRDKTSILSAKTLKEYQKLLDKSIFFRVHKSHIVNINFVTKYFRSGYLLLEDNSTVEIAKKTKSDFLDHILGSK